MPSSSQGDYWFIIRNGSPILLALSDAISESCVITQTENTISWTAISDAEYYEYVINDKKYITTDTSVTLEFQAYKGKCS